MGKAIREKIRLNSTGLKKDGKTKTGYFKTITKNKRLHKDKMKVKRFDPRAWDAKKKKYGMHVIFEEGKIK